MAYKQLTTQDVDDLDLRLEELRLLIETQEEGKRKYALLDCVDKIRQYLGGNTDGKTS